MCSVNEMRGELENAAQTKKSCSGICALRVKSHRIWWGRDGNFVTWTFASFLAGLINIVEHTPTLILQQEAAGRERDFLV